MGIYKPVLISVGDTFSSFYWFAKDFSTSTIKALRREKSMNTTNDFIGPGKKGYEAGLLTSFFSAILGLGLLGLSVHLGVRNDFLATLILHGGEQADYALAGVVMASFIAGVGLIARHIMKESVGESFYDHTYH